MIMQLAELAKRQGWQVDVLTTDVSFQRALTASGIGVVDLDCIWREIRPLRDMRGLLRLARFLRPAGYTVVHTHTSKAGFVGRLAAKLAGVPVVLHTVHGFAFHEQSPPLTIQVYAALERLAAHAADCVVTVSEFHRGWAQRLGIGNPGKVVAIPNGISRERVQSTCSRELMRARLDVGRDEYVILASGRLAPQKGLEYLLQAVPMFRPLLGRVPKVLLAGDGPARADLETLAVDLGIAPQVRFLGFRSDIGDLLEAADLVVLPSLREGLSIALLEAMAARKPIVTTAIGSNLEVTQQGAAALVVPPKDSRALAEAIVLLATTPKEADRLAQAAYVRYSANYREDRMQNAYLEKYHEIITRKLTAEVGLADVEKYFDEEVRKHPAFLLYDTRPCNVLLKSETFARELLGPIDGHKRILEVGAGDCTDSLTLAGSTNRVWAIDIAARRLGRGRREIDRVGKANRVLPIRMDAHRLAFPDNCFDLIIGNSVLLFLKRGQFLEECYRTLKPAGRALFANESMDHPLLRVWRSLLPRLRARERITRRLSVADIEALIEQFGEGTHREFYLLSVLFAPLVSRFGTHKAIGSLGRFVNGVDELLLRALPVLRRYCWIAVLELRKQETKAGAVS